MSMGYYDENDFGELLGKTLVRVKVIKDGGDTITFVCDDDTEYALYHDQDCCEAVDIEDICGDLDCLLGTPILEAEEASSDCENDLFDFMPYEHRKEVFKNILREGSDEHDRYIPESQTWTFYKLATIKGSVTIRWYGESNGYYSERVSFKRTDNL